MIYLKANSLLISRVQCLEPGFVLACLGVGALAGSVAAYLDAGLPMQLVSAAVVSLLSFFFLRPLALRMSSTTAAVSGVEALTGRECRVTQGFDAESGLGRCKVDGDDWRAQLSNRAQAPNAQDQASVWIERVESNTLIVTTEKPNS